MVSTNLDKFKNNRWFFISLILITLIVVYAGTGFAMGVTDEPEFCGTCHVMYEPVRTHDQSVHAGLSCNECHAPKPLVEKLAFKTYAGTKDIYKNLFAEIDDVIHASDLTKGIINTNCIECHTMTIINVEADMDAKQYCTDCHQQVPHFPKNPIAERRVAGE